MFFYINFLRYITYTNIFSFIIKSFSYIIQDGVGHENPKMLEQIYLHITKEAKLNLNSQLEKL